jgi:CheY-like chemotaxis protein
MDVNAHAKGLEVVVRTSGELPIVDGDPSRVRQILVNLLGNAIKFTDAGKITVSLSATSRPTEGFSDWIFVIQDKGIGIPPEALSRIFDSFDQGDSSTTRKYGGTGLGLAITKELVLLMGGQITVASQLGEGSTFTVQLPMPLSKQSELPLFATKQPALTKSATTDAPLLVESVASGTRHVLLAEDNPTTQTLISILLQQMGIKLTIVDDGQAAIDFLADKKVDLILMDCQMPKLDGFETTTQLRAQGVSTPIVALTAYARAEDEEQCLAAGMNDFLSKPFRQAELKDVLVRWLGADALSQTQAPVSVH